MSTGRVTKYFEDAGYGFIRDDESLQSCFVHIKDVEDQAPLTPGERVRYTLVPSERKPGSYQCKQVSVARG
jgi:cold shock CspA family protein